MIRGLEEDELKKAADDIRYVQSAFMRLSKGQQRVVVFRLEEVALDPDSPKHGFDTRVAKKLHVTREDIRQRRTQAQGRLKNFFQSWNKE